MEYNQTDEAAAAEIKEFLRLAESCMQQKDLAAILRTPATTLSKIKNFTVEKSDISPKMVNAVLERCRGFTDGLDWRSAEEVDQLINKLRRLGPSNYLNRTIYFLPDRLSIHERFPPHPMFLAPLIPYDQAQL